MFLSHSTFGCKPQCICIIYIYNWPSLRSNKRVCACNAKVMGSIPIFEKSKVTYNCIAFNLEVMQSVGIKLMTLVLCFTVAFIKCELYLGNEEKMHVSLCY